MLPGMRVDPREIAAVFLGGMIGAVLRAQLFESWTPAAGAWPWATFTVNILGALLLGYFVARMDRPLSGGGYVRPFLGPGFCGALTTFSTLQLELLHMIEDGAYDLASAYALASVSLGLLAVALSARLVRRAAAGR